MIVLSNSIPQTLNPGQSVTFDMEIMHTGKSECHRLNTGTVNLRTGCGAIYEVSYGANIGASEAGTAQIAIALNGSALSETTMIRQTATAGELNNVYNSTFVKVCTYMSGESISVINTGTSTVNIGADSKLSIKRVA